MLLPQSAQLSYFFTPYGWTIRASETAQIGELSSQATQRLITYSWGKVFISMELPPANAF